MTTATAMKDGQTMNRKIVSVSSKRQITIPQIFFNLLGFGTEAECLVRDDALVIRPIRRPTGGEFAEEILEDLISEGLSGDELLAAFKERQARIRPAVEQMISEAENIAHGTAEYATYDDIFGGSPKKDGV